MGKLNVIDATNYILEGEFEKIKVPAKAYLDEESVLKAVENYKVNFVTPGLAIGELNDGFLTMPTEFGDQVVEQIKDPAFMIIDIWWDTEKKSIFGKIILLDSPDGVKMKAAIQQRVECCISSSETDAYPVKDENSSRLLLRVSEVKNFKASIMNFQNTI